MTSLNDLYQYIDNLPKIEYISNDVLTVIFNYLEWQEFSSIKEYYKLYYMSFNTYFKTIAKQYDDDCENKENKENKLEEYKTPTLYEVCMCKKNEYLELVKYLCEDAVIERTILPTMEDEVIYSMYFSLFGNKFETFCYLNEK